MRVWSFAMADVKGKLRRWVARLDGDASLTIAVIAGVPIAIVALTALIGFLTAHS